MMCGKPRLSFWQLFNMSFGFLGIQSGFGLQLANRSAIYSKLGAAASKIPILWLAGPMTGLLIQPIIGSMSDRTWNRLGRRRPYFLVGADPGFDHPIFHARFTDLVGGGDDAVGAGCVDQYFDGAVPGVCGGQVAAGAAHDWLRDAEHFHRHRRGDRVRERPTNPY